MQKMYYEDQTFKKNSEKITGNQKKKNVEQVQTKEDKIQKGLGVWEILEDLKPLEFGGKCQNI